MKPISKYTWRHIKSKLFEMYAHKAVFVRPYEPYIYNRSSYAMNKSSSWSNPPLAPPARKFDTSINFGFNQWQISNAS